uniref:HECT-domain (Ubiquitin-transferase) domain-containing protein n=1 Tax=Toxoplasma gondii COUG TaxID=1074873 RepID=A0A2G8Y4N7_TOXGO|nr:HECT-domain (ubiquitin-transferase) domain-containing protein [Toxoplasma gondii COUG]
MQGDCGQRERGSEPSVPFRHSSLPPLLRLPSCLHPSFFLFCLSRLLSLLSLLFLLSLLSLLSLRLSLVQGVFLPWLLRIASHVFDLPVFPPRFPPLLLSLVFPRRLRHRFGSRSDGTSESVGATATTPSFGGRQKSSMDQTYSCRICQKMKNRRRGKFISCTPCVSPHKSGAWERIISSGEFCATSREDRLFVFLSSLLPPHPLFVSLLSFQASFCLLSPSLLPSPMATVVLRRPPVFHSVFRPFPLGGSDSRISPPAIAVGFSFRSGLPLFVPCCCPSSLSPNPFFCPPVPRERGKSPSIVQRHSPERGTRFLSVRLFPGDSVLSPSPTTIISWRRSLRVKARRQTVCMRRQGEARLSASSLLQILDICRAKNWKTQFSRALGDLHAS